MPPYQLYRPPSDADHQIDQSASSPIVNGFDRKPLAPVTLPPLSSVSADFKRPLPAMSSPFQPPPMSLHGTPFRNPLHPSTVHDPQLNNGGSMPLSSPFYQSKPEYNLQKTPSYPRIPFNASSVRSLGRSTSTPNPLMEFDTRTLPPLQFTPSPALSRSSPAHHVSSELVTPFAPSRKRKPEELYTPTTPPEDEHYTITTPHGTINTGGILPPKVYEGEYPEAFISGDRLPSTKEDEKEGQEGSTKKSTPTTSSVNPWDYQRTNVTARCKFSTKELWAMNIVFKCLNKKPPVVERQRLAAWFGKYTKHVSIWFQNARQSETKVQSTPDSQPSSDLKSRASAKPTQFDFDLQGPTQLQISAINAILKGRLSRDDFFNHVHVEGAAIKARSGPQLSGSGSLDAILRAQELPRRHGQGEVKKMDASFDIANMLSDSTSSSPPPFDDDTFDDDLPASKRRRAALETPCRPRKGENSLPILGDGRATSSLLIASSSRARNIAHSSSSNPSTIEKPTLPITSLRSIRPSASFRLRDSYTRTQSENDVGIAPASQIAPVEKVEVAAASQNRASVPASEAGSEETDTSVLDAASSLMAMFANQGSQSEGSRSVGSNDD